MQKSPSTAELIRQRLESLPLGEPLTSTDFLELGTRASVDQALSRLVRAGYLDRVARGIFMRAKVNRYVGKVMPDPVSVAAALARRSGAKVQIHGAEAARRLGLSTQMPVQAVFLTSGPSRRIKFGKAEIRLQHASARKLALAGRPAGIALAALWYLGKDSVTPATLETIRKKLPAGEFEALCAAAQQMPAWMSDVFFRFQRQSA